MSPGHRLRAVSYRLVELDGCSEAFHPAPTRLHCRQRGRSLLTTDAQLLKACAIQHASSAKADEISALRDSITQQKSGAPRRHWKSMLIVLCPQSDSGGAWSAGSKFFGVSAITAILHGCESVPIL